MSPNTEEREQQLAEELERESVAIRLAVCDCLMAWSLLEHVIYLVFQQVLNTQDNAAEAIWTSIIAFNARLDMVNAAIAGKIIEGDLGEIWKRLAARIGRKSRKRNEIAHGTILQKFETDDPSKTRIVLKPYFLLAKDAAELSAADISAREASFHELAHSVQWFMGQLALHLKRIPAIHGPEPDLIQRIRQAISRDSKDTDDPSPPFEE